MRNSLIVIALVTMALAGCSKAVPPVPANETAANITALDEGNLSSDANITDVPADDGDAPSDAETNAK